MGDRKRSDVPRKFFSKAEQLEIVDAIGAAELNTSGEIRFHVERDVPTKDPINGDAYQQARAVFAKLGMHQTESRNGVLIYLAVRTRKFAVVGDEELHKRVGDDFWVDVVKLMTEHFAQDLFGQGVATGITLIGEKLGEFFPYQDDDVNELSDEISFE
jgi:uncharacterized membrane protein